MRSEEILLQHIHRDSWGPIRLNQGLREATSAVSNSIFSLQETWTEMHLDGKPWLQIRANKLKWGLW
jgi:hypothetical protein